MLVLEILLGAGRFGKRLKLIFLKSGADFTGRGFRFMAD